MRLIGHRGMSAPGSAAADTAGSAAPLSDRFAKAGDAVYRFFYGIGIHTARRFKRNLRHLRRTAAPLRRFFGRLWEKWFRRPAAGIARRCRELAAACPAARRELADAARANPLKVFPCLFRLNCRAVKHYRRELGMLWRLIAPAAALAVLVITVSVWSHTDFCLALTYDGQQIGYIDNEATYIEASAMARDRVINVDNAFSVEAAPKLSVTVQGDHHVLQDHELCDAILRTAGDSIAEATGLYVDGSFVSAMESGDELAAVLESIKDGYYDKNDPDQRAEFIQSVSTLEGLFPSLAVVDGNGMKEKLISEAVVEKTYTVQPGDTLSTIAEKNNMLTSELRKLNPDTLGTDMIIIGDELMVQRSQPFLQVKVIKTVRTTETIDYTTQYVNNTDKPVTYTAVKTQGEEGSQDVVTEVTLIDGMEQSRRIVSTTVTKQPVTKVIERGTKKVTSSSGTTVVIGDGVATGSMQWPVPICHNMSRGFRSGHYGLDICNGPVTVRNKPAVAADGGKVIYAGWYYGYGNYVKIQHANGLCTAYGHLNSISVVQGQTVSRGQQIGLIGSTGQSTGPHLHFEVIKNGVRVNPLNYVSP